MEQKGISYEVISKEIEELRKEVRFSKTRCNIILFTSGLFSLVYFGYFIKYEMFGGGLTRTLFILPIIINMILWFYWFTIHNIQLLKRISQNFRDIYVRSNLEKDSSFEIYQGALYRLRIQRKIENIVNILISLQFLFMLFSFLIIFS